MEDRPMLPPEEFQTFSRKSPAYVLWFHATAVQKGWNTLKVLRDGVIDDTPAAVVAMGSRQWPTDADLEAATSATRDEMLGYAASGGATCMEVLGEEHPLSKGFSDIRMTWESTKLQHPKDIQNLVSKLLAIGEEMNMALQQLELVSRACLGSTRLLHLSSSELAGGNAIPALEEDRAFLEAYKNQHSHEAKKGKSPPRSLIDDLRVVSNQKLCDDAIKEMTSSKWLVSGVHLTFSSQSDVDTAQRSVLDLSTFGFDSMRTTRQSNGNTSLSNPVATLVRIAPSNSSGILSLPAPVDTGERGPGVTQALKTPTRIDSFQTPLKPPALPRRSSRRGRKGSRVVRGTDLSASTQSGFTTASCVQGGTASESISLRTELPERSSLDGDGTHTLNNHLSTYDHAQGHQSTQPRHSYGTDGSSAYSS
jgi:hypothetical protein